MAATAQPRQIRPQGQLIAPLLGRWQLTEDGIVHAEAWRNPAGALHPFQFMYACVGKKP